MKFPQDTQWSLPATSAASELLCGISLEEAYALEEETSAQASCPQWFTARKSRITASIFHRVTNRVKAVNNTFLESIFGGKSFESAATSYGRNTEAEAKASYVKQFPSRHLHDCGFVVNPKYSFIGASPDAKVCDKGVTGILEIKCPYATKDQPLADTASSKSSFCLGVAPEGLRLKRSHQYYIQVQGQLLVTGAPFCDFYVYTKKDTHIERILPDRDLCQEMLKKLHEFYTKHAQKYLLS